jgi:hypothetical protein
MIISLGQKVEISLIILSQRSPSALSTVAQRLAQETSAKASAASVPEKQIEQR